MSKSADAFRTISEVADWLGIPAHVLRFWESKFTQVKPVKRAGGRRYYRPADMQLLGGIRKLLHDEGMTIKGVQKVMREQGVRHVAAMSPPLEDDLEEAIAGIALDVPETDEPRGTVLSFDRTKGEAQANGPTGEASPLDAQAPDHSEATTDDSPPPAEVRSEEASGDTELPDRIAEPDTTDGPAGTQDAAQTSLSFDDATSETQQTAQPDPAADIPAERPNQSEPESVTPSQPDPETVSTADAGDTAAAPESRHAPAASGDLYDAEGDGPHASTVEDAPAAPEDAAASPENSDAAASPPAATHTPPPPRVAKIMVPDDPGDDVPAAASALSILSSLDKEQLAARLPALSDLGGRMADLRARMTGGTR